MLSYGLLKNHAGMLLVGDYTSLRWLHEVIHDVNERSWLIADKEGLFLNLAYDIRKAFEGNRETLPPPEHYQEIGLRYGVKIIWPLLLMQSRILRVSLAYLDHSRKCEAIVYALEAIIEEALKDDFGVHGQVVIERWEHLDPVDRGAIDKLYSRCGIFQSWKKSARRNHIANLLESFDHNYELLYKYRVERKERHLISPEAFEEWENAEWPDPHW